MGTPTNVRISLTLERGEAGTWVAGTPELDVFSQGDTREEALRNAVEAIELFLEVSAERGTLGELLHRAHVAKVTDQPTTLGELLEVASERHVRRSLLERWNEFLRRPAPTRREIVLPLPDHAIA